MTELNFPKYNFKIKRDKNKHQIFDVVRKKYIALTPEEWVRQHLLHYLINEKKVSPNWIAVETAVKYNELIKRPDVVVYKNNKPFLLAECKAATITEQTFQQLVRYNYSLQAHYMVLTNGVQHFFAQIDYAEKKIKVLPDLPDSLME
jgi:predicted type IV restriction endonuclease